MKTKTPSAWIAAVTTITGLSERRGAMGYGGCWRKGKTKRVGAENEC